MLNQIGGLDHPDSGEIWLDGTEITSLERKTLTRLRLWKIGFVFQEYNLIPVLSALENVEYVMMLQNISAKQRKQRAKQVLADVGLSAMENRRPNELSGGQQQRVAIARAFAAEPSILFADEPTGNLDSANGDEIMKILMEVVEERNATLVVVTHDTSLSSMGDRVLTIRDGVVVND